MANPDPQDVESLLELFNQSDWDEMYLKTDGLEIFLSNDPAATGPAAAVAAPAVANQPVVAAAAAGPAGSTPATATAAASPAATVPDGMIGVTAPNLGTFYRAPKPGAPPYVEIGQEVCLIEVMKLFTPVSAGTAGVVREICIDDGQMVEFGQLLVVIEPTA